MGYVFGQALHSCTFEGNAAYNPKWKPDDTGTTRPSGGAIFVNPLRYYFEENPLQLTNCTFSSNFSNQGGAIYSIQPIHAVNCIFERNQAEDGGVIYVDGTVQQNDFIFQNSTFYNNRATLQGGVLAFKAFYQMTNVYHKVVFQNSILWNNKAQEEADNILGVNAVTRIENCMIDVTNYRDAFIADTAFFQYGGYFLDSTNTQNFYNQTPLFIDTLGGNFALENCSPAINAGNNNMLIPMTEDIFGNARIVGTSIDIGAIENPERDTTNLSATICEGEVFDFWGNTFLESGEYNVTIPSATTCDSLIKLNLTVSTTRETTIDTTINAGQSVQIGAFSFDEVGTYFIRLENKYGCDSLVRLNVDFTTALQDIAPAALQMEVYPNPTTSTTQLRFQTTERQKAQIRVLDYTGRQWQIQYLQLPKGTTSWRIDLPNVSGIYWVQVLVEGQPRRNFRVVKR